MPQNINEAYLEARVRTATPQRRQLMLIEGALRFARQALEHWDGGLPPEDVYAAIVRCRDIVAEIYGGIRQDDMQVARQVAAIYMFLFRLLSEAPLHQDPQRLRDAVRILEEERKTWEMVCAQMPEAPDGAGTQTGTSQEITARDAIAGTHPANGSNSSPPHVPETDSPPASQFSLEA